MSDSNPYGTPVDCQSNPLPTKRSHSVAKRFAIHFAIAAVYALTFFFLTYLFPAVSDETQFIVALVGLFFGSVIAACYCPTNPALLAAMTGISWGFLWTLSAAISIQNGRGTIAWSRFIPAMFIVPVIMFCVTWPVMRMSIRRASTA